MEDKEVIEILKKILQTHELNSEEKEALRSAIGILSWTKLTEGVVKGMKRKRDKLLNDDEPSTSFE